MSNTTTVSWRLAIVQVVLLSISAAESAAPPLSGLANPDTKILNHIRSSPGGEAYLKDPAVTAYLLKLLKSDYSKAATDSPIWAIGAVTMRECSSDGKLAGFHRVQFKDQEHVFFTTSGLLNVGRTTLGGVRRGTSWWVTLSPTQSPRVSQVGKDGFDLAGASVGIVAHNDALYCLAPNSALYALTRVKKGDLLLTDVRLLGYLPLLGSIKHVVPSATKYALQGMSPRSTLGVNVVVETKCKNGFVRLVDIPLSWADLVRTHALPSPANYRIPVLHYLGRFQVNKRDCLLGFDVCKNQLAAFGVDGNVVCETTLMITEHATVQKVCNILLAHPEPPDSFWGEPVRTLTFHGRVAPNDIRPLQMRRFYQLCTNAGGCWVSYIEMAKSSVVIRKWTDDGMGAAELIPTAHSVEHYRLFDYDGQLCVLTAESDGRSIPAPKLPYLFKIYLRDKSGWRFVREWHSRLPGDTDPGGIESSRRYFEPIIKDGSLVVYTLPIRCLDAAPTVETKSFRLKD